MTEKEEMTIHYLVELLHTQLKHDHLLFYGDTEQFDPQSSWLWRDCEKLWPEITKRFFEKSES